MPSRKTQGNYGLRFEDMSAEEREYYQEFWQEPAPQEGDPGYRLPEKDVVRARSRMATGLCFTLLLLGILLTLISMMAGHLTLTLLCSLIVVLALGLLVAVRRRLFPSLRIAGENPLPPNKKARWFWLPHSLVLAGLASAVVSFAVIPEIYGQEDPIILRSHVLMWNEFTMLFLLSAALLYGLLSLAIYTPEDTDESIVRPTDYAEKQREKDIARAKHRNDNFYDSDWITGKDR